MPRRAFVLVALLMTITGACRSTSDKEHAGRPGQGDVLPVLQRMLGHASAALTLDRYGHLMPGQAHTVADRLDDMARQAGPAAGAEVVTLR